MLYIILIFALLYLLYRYRYGLLINAMHLKHYYTVYRNFLSRVILLRIDNQSFHINGLVVNTGTIPNGTYPGFFDVVDNSPAFIYYSWRGKSVVSLRLFKANPGTGMYIGAECYTNVELDRYESCSIPDDF